MALVPTVIEQSNNGERAFDLYSRLLRDRIIILNDEVNDITAGIIVAQMLFLEAEDPDADITFYINSPGGSVSAGMSIFDTMNYIKPDVATVGMGMCASMGAFLLSAGQKGKRYALPHTTVMIHQPLGGAKGQATEIEIAARNIIETKALLNQLLAEHTGQSLETIQKDTDRDNYMKAPAAKEYGLIDEVVYKRISK